MSTMTKTEVRAQLGGKEIIIETGIMAKQAGGSVVVRCEDTMVLVVATSAPKAKDECDFLPLTVEYLEKTFATGKIPGGFFKREGRPTESAILTARFIDRPIRPLFPENYYFDTQVIATVLSASPEALPEMLSMIGASAALVVSDIPFIKPVAGCRVSRIDGQFKINASLSELERSDLDLVVAASEDAVLMVEASVPFYSISGSDFVEMFVGVGASRVRDLFEQGKKNAPCIIFIDEIDAVGRQRGSGLGGGHDEREQTLNQLLVEMDGFESNDGVIIIAATNRPDVLDPALLRPGRFDRRVVVAAPDLLGREAILKIHAARVPLHSNVDLMSIARGTPGFCGADLENLVNEAALYAARLNKKKVTMEHLEIAKDKVLMGSERRSMLISDEEKKVTAYHEAGHTLVAKLIDNTDPVHKVTIIPRGRALGLTQQLPERDKYTQSKEYSEAMISVLMGGRVAEEIFFNQITTGASNDIDRATDIAHKMVCYWGMSDKLGAVRFGKDNQQVFLGKEMGTHHSPDYSESTAQKIDDEIHMIIQRNYDRAKTVLIENREKLESLAKALIEYEVLDAVQIDMAINGEELPPIAPDSTPPSNGNADSKEDRVVESSSVKPFLNPGPQGA